MTTLTFELLKQRQRSERSQYPEALGLRVHRALSWLQKAESCADRDSRFIFLWIAFNAAYASDIPVEYRSGEQQVFGDFIARLCKNDKHSYLADLVWHSFTGPIRALLDNPFVYHPYWQYVNGKISEDAWKQSFAAAKSLAAKALGQNDTSKLLTIVLSRIYTLRNQLIHGGATCNSELNRQQLRDCTHMMEALVPRVISIMMDTAQSHWGEPYYPVVKD